MQQHSIQKHFLLLVIGICIGLRADAQHFKPYFDQEEYRQLMLISIRTTANPDYYKNFPKPNDYHMIYQSAVLGLDNLWDLWTNDKGTAVISIRGTTSKSESWLANFYAAMVPAQGVLQINDTSNWSYKLADNPRAAVHVGWLLSTAYLSKDILAQINALYLKGTKSFYIIGHSQGGAIAFLLNSYLHQLQKSKQLATDIYFKTYCSAAPKPGNLYYAYEYEAMTQNGWAYNVVNAADWVPETPISIQTTNDFNNTNPFINAKQSIKKQKFPNRLVLRYAYGQLDRPTKRAQKHYEKYLGKYAAKMVQKNLPDFIAPQYYKSNHYVRTGNTIVLTPDSTYYRLFPDNDKTPFVHHVHQPYLYLLQHTDFKRQ